MKFQLLLIPIPILLLQPVLGQVATTITSFDILQTISHDRNAFTQGLTFGTDSSIVYESTGKYGQSDVRKVDLSNGNVLQVQRTPDDIFGEGLAYKDGQLIHITWKSRRGFVFDADTLSQQQEFSFSTSRNEGWGITYDGSQFLVTDGSSNLHKWDSSFNEQSRVQVRIQTCSSCSDGPLDKLNEIEMDGSTVLANVWKTDYIVRIDPGSGRVTHRYDLSALPGGSGVLNGIAIASNGDLWVTGKNWPNMYRIRLGTEGTTEPPPEGGGGLCFSCDSTVNVQGKGVTSLQELQVGDWILGRDNNYQPVYAWGHYAPETLSGFLLLTFQDDTFLEVTPAHLLYLGGKSNPVRADSLQTGDVLHGDAQVIQSIQTVTKRGLCAPLTLDGTVLVNGNILASNYIALQSTPSEYVIPRFLSHHNLAHWYLFPFRTLCQNFPATAICHSYNEQGMPVYVASGIQLFRWVELLLATPGLLALMLAVGSTPVLLVLLLAMGWWYQQRFYVRIRKSKQL